MQLSHACAGFVMNQHSRPQRLRSIWPAPWIETLWQPQSQRSRSMALAKWIAACGDENDNARVNLGGDSLYSCALTRIYPQEGRCGGLFPLSSFALENWETEQENNRSCIYHYPGVRKTRATPDVCLLVSSVWYHAFRFIVEHWD